MPACPFGEQIALYQRDGGLFPIDRLTPDEVGHYRGCLQAFKREQRNAFASDEYGIDLKPRPSACDFDSASRAVHAARVERSFGSSKLLTVRRRSGNVGI
jgi:hypothetical protein